jgi:predicted secreted hydrolase
MAPRRRSPTKRERRRAEGFPLYTKGVYSGAWQIWLDEPVCVLEVRPWMADEEINFPLVTYWEGAVHFEGICNGAPTRRNGCIELPGYVVNLPLQ